MENRNQPVTDAKLAPRRVRRSQEERRTETRARLSKATLELLSEVGYERISTTMIVKRAGVSNGALMHHFATKVDLLVSAFELQVKRWEGGREEFHESSATPVPMSVFLRHLWKNVYSKPDYIASLELMLAARGDSELRMRLQEVMSKWEQERDVIWREIVGFGGKDGDRGVFLHLNMCLLRGMAIHASFNKDSTVNEQLLDTWVRIADGLLASKEFSASGAPAQRASKSSRPANRDAQEVGD